MGPKSSSLGGDMGRGLVDLPRVGEPLRAAMCTRRECEGVNAQLRVLYCCMVVTKVKRRQEIVFGQRNGRWGRQVSGSWLLDVGEKLQGSEFWHDANCFRPSSMPNIGWAGRTASSDYHHLSDMTSPTLKTRSVPISTHWKRHGRCH
jgi:hypothetical protein